ncbi:MAG: DNA methyltransferase [Dehalococcoidia bacterium]|nr:DNA methyltransferase [Dehalococcoidia bacterium]
MNYEDGDRVVTCFCGERVARSIVRHFKVKHVEQWEQWAEMFVKLRGLGYPLKRIMRLFRAGNGRLLFSWTVIERSIRKEVEAGRLPYTPPPKNGRTVWQPDGFTLATRTVWDFPRRGDWAVHSGDYRGNWPPQIPRNLIERYTKRGDIVVDSFVGGGTTLIEAWLLGRPSIGLDISKLALQTTNAKLREMEDLASRDGAITLDLACRPKVIEGSALELSRLLTNHNVARGEVRLLCVHPPYLDSLAYTGRDSNDLALISDPEVFCARMRAFAREAMEVLSPGGICGVLIGDVRKRGKTVPLGMKTLQSFLDEHFEVDSIVVKTQHKDRSSEFYVARNIRGMLMAHEYLFILKKPTERIK